MDWGFDGTMEEKEGKLSASPPLSLLFGPKKNTANSHLHGWSPKTPPLPCRMDCIPSNLSQNKSFPCKLFTLRSLFRALRRSLRHRDTIITTVHTCYHSSLPLTIRSASVCLFYSPLQKKITPENAEYMECNSTSLLTLLMPPTPLILSISYPLAATSKSCSLISFSSSLPPSHLHMLTLLRTILLIETHLSVPSFQAH